MKVTTDTEFLVSPGSSSINSRLAGAKESFKQCCSQERLKEIAIITGVIVLLVVLVAAELIWGLPSTCFTRDRNVYPYFGTSTAYDVVRGDIVRPKSNCKPVQMWMLARHGTTYPKKSEIVKILKLVKIRDEIIKNHKKGAGNLCSTDLKKLKSWQLDPNLRINTAENVVLQGSQDMHLLAERLKKTFPELLKVNPKNVKRGDFVFRATNTPQTNSSLRSFSQSLFRSSDVIVTPVRPPANDSLLLAYKNCPAWEERYWKNHYDAESNKFAVGPEVKKLLGQMNQRLGFNQTIDYDMVKAMYNLCRYETAWHPKISSIWCSLFSNNELKILEYQEDLDNYYYGGPGRRENAKLGCQPLKDMLTRFRNVVNGNATNHTKGVFYFTHAVTVETLMAVLGTDGGSSKPLLANDYSKSANRKFRTSLMNPFAANVIAVLYKCNGTKSRYSVSFYTSEKLEQIRGCQAGLCDWDYIENKFSLDIRNCSMNFC